MFFKKKYDTKILSNKRLILLLRRDKQILTRKYKTQNSKINSKKEFGKNLKKNFLRKKSYNGNFFFKKFFFKTLLKSKEVFRYFYLLPKKIRQKHLTKIVSENLKLTKKANNSFTYTASTLLLRSGLIFTFKDVLILINLGKIYHNGALLYNKYTLLHVGDCIQLRQCKKFLVYIKLIRKSIKKKLALHRYNSWLYYAKNAKVPANVKKKKRKTPEYIHLFLLFKLNNPKILEIDYLTLTIFVISKEHSSSLKNYFFDKLFSFSLYKLYNFKRIN